MSVYSVLICCLNCGLRRRVDLPKERLVADARCPECGCKTLERVH